MLFRLPSNSRSILTPHPNATEGKSTPIPSQDQNPPVAGSASPIPKEFKKGTALAYLSAMMVIYGNRAFFDAFSRHLPDHLVIFGNT
jgi:hypothetical protein